MLHTPSQKVAEMHNAFACQPPLNRKKKTTACTVSGAVSFSLSQTLYNEEQLVGVLY